MKLVVSAGTYDAAVSAIQNGADEVLLAPAIPAEALTELFPYARSRGTALTLDFTRSCADAELNRRAALLQTLYPLGLYGVAAGDAGLLHMARSAAPGCSIIWGAPCHNADDIHYAASQGCSRAVLSPFLPSETILSLQKTSQIQLAVWVLCPLCPCGDPNTCLLGKEHGLQSCAYVCRSTVFAGDDGKALLKTRDFCLLGHMRELPRLTAQMLVPDPSPEAVGFFTRVARSAANGEYYEERSVHGAFAALGREAPTDAPYTSVGDIFTRDVQPLTRNERFWETERHEAREARIPVRFLALAADGEPFRLAVDDYQKHTLFVEGSVPARDAAAPTSGEELNAVWHETPAPYVCKDARTQIGGGLRIAAGEAPRLRERALEQLGEQRSALPDHPPGHYTPEARLLPRADKPCVTVKVAKIAQVTPELLRLPPERLYVPLGEASGDPLRAEDLVRSETVPVAVFPRIIQENERNEVGARLKRLHDIGFREALTYSPGQAVLALRHSFTPRADWNAANAQTLRHAKTIGVISCTLAPWMTLEEIRALNHVADTEMIVYGRLPLLLTRQCLIRKRSGVCSCDNMNNELSDGKGGLLPLVRESGHGTLVYDSHKLWLEPYKKQWRHIGLWAVRLDFTTENAKECVQIANAYLGRGDYEPHTTTTGFYAPGEHRRRWL
ncbi:MAG: U32 family peptidase [Oscillospiraceae bacterium]|jgi:putative protease|nr:U32 family peptidase [Oscillospiraceae bacterium]